MTIRQLGASSGTATLFPLVAHPLQPRLYRLNARPQQASVGFQLRLTRPSKSNTTLLTLEVGPPSHQPRAHVRELGQLHLKFSFMGASPLGEDVENQSRTRQHPARQCLLEVSLLTRAECVIKDHQLRLIALAGVCDFLELTLADKRPGMGRVARSCDGRHRIATGGCHQLLKLQKAEIALRTRQLQLHEYSALTALMTLKEHGESGALPEERPVVSLQLVPHHPRQANAHYAPAQRWK